MTSGWYKLCGDVRSDAGGMGLRGVCPEQVALLVKRSLMTGCVGDREQMASRGTRS